MLASRWRVDRGPFTIQGKRATKSAEWTESAIIILTITATFVAWKILWDFAKTTSKYGPFQRRNSPVAVHAEVCVRASQARRKLPWRIFYHTCARHQARKKMPPIAYRALYTCTTGCLPALQEKRLLSVRYGRHTRTPHGAHTIAYAEKSAWAPLTVKHPVL